MRPFREVAYLLVSAMVVGAGLALVCRIFVGPLANLAPRVDVGPK